MPQTPNEGPHEREMLDPRRYDVVVTENLFGDILSDEAAAKLIKEVDQGDLILVKGSRGVATDISHPAQAQVGLGFTGIRNTTVNLDYAWVDWSVFNELPVDFAPAGGPPADMNGLDRVLLEDYEDSWAVRGSVDYAFRNGWSAGTRFWRSIVRASVKVRTNAFDAL